MVRDLSTRFSEENFNYELAQVDWEPIFTRTQGNIEMAFSKIYNKLNKMVNKHAPLKSLSKRKFKQSSKPWITKGLLKSYTIYLTLYGMRCTTMASEVLCNEWFSSWLSE